MSGDFVDLDIAENIENFNLDAKENKSVIDTQIESNSEVSPSSTTSSPSYNISFSQIYPKSSETPIESSPPNNQPPNPSPPSPPSPPTPPTPNDQSTNPTTTPTLSNKMVTKDKPEIVTINGWTKQNQTYFRYCLHRLKYYRIINNFFFFELKRIEGHLSWSIIVLSSLSSVLSLVNTNENIFPNSVVIVKWGLVLLTLFTTLIGSYIKKQQFIDRINNIDRYLQQLNHCVEELNITFILEPNKRESYDEFCKKYIPLIKNLSVSPASFSPSEWKHTVYMITKHYPELIHVDGSNEELLWPWFYMEDNETISKFPENKRRAESQFGEKVMKSYQPV